MINDNKLMIPLETTILNEVLDIIQFTRKTINKNHVVYYHKKEYVGFSGKKTKKYYLVIEKR